MTDIFFSDSAVALAFLITSYLSVWHCGMVLVLDGYCFLLERIFCGMLPGRRSDSSRPSFSTRPFLRYRFGIIFLIFLDSSFDKPRPLSRSCVRCGASHRHRLLLCSQLLLSLPLLSAGVGIRLARSASPYTYSQEFSTCQSSRLQQTMK